MHEELFSRRVIFAQHEKKMKQVIIKKNKKKVPTEGEGVTVIIK